MKKSKQGSSRVELRRMTPAEQRQYRIEAVGLLADEQARAFGTAPAEARAQAERAFDVLQQQGDDAQRQHVFTLHFEAAPIGWLWFEVRGSGENAIAYLKDIHLHRPWRGRGLGLQAMRAFEDEARRAGCRSVVLNVFAHNAAAIGFYRKQHYAVASHILRKDIQDTDPYHGP